VLVISDNNKWLADILLGRDFLINNQISVLYILPKTEREAKVELFSNIAFADVMDIPKNSFSLSDIQTDFDITVKDRLIHVTFCTLENVQNTSIVQVSNDEYLVKVSLKDDSTYTFAPQKFAWSERMQIREITDDLLKRGISSTVIRCIVLE